ncbi:MAG: PPOX class F420-dependent oxidoreductase [Gammaproteobacteria bacterium]|nr:PPOX class F420-dependent oxidoreductase [Gammaproteobacteria bacterium]
MAEKIEGAALNEFLMAGTRTAKIAGVKSDGSPIVSPVWFTMDADDVVFTTMCTSLKYKIIQRDSRVSICVDEEVFPYGFAVLQGVASIHKLSVDELLQWTTKIAARYVPEPLVRQFGKRNAVAEEVLIRVSPDRVFAFSGVAD